MERKNSLKIKSFLQILTLVSLTQVTCVKCAEVTILSHDVCVLCQMCRHCKSLSLDVCVILICSLQLWCFLFSVLGACWSCPYSVEDFLCRFKSLGSGMDSIILWSCICFAILWGEWIERNAGGFLLNLLWDRAYYCLLSCKRCGYNKNGLYVIF